MLALTPVQPCMGCAGRQNGRRPYTRKPSSMLEVACHLPRLDDLHSSFVAPGQAGRQGHPAVAPYTAGSWAQRQVLVTFSPASTWSMAFTVQGCAIRVYNCMTGQSLCMAAGQACGEAAGCNDG